jgi:fatty-acyl-CoA synthase
VVRVTDPRWGEVPVAFVSCSDGSVTETELIGLCKRDLASYKCPRRFQFIEFSEFPRSTSGKVQRHELEARLTAARS